MTFESGPSVRPDLALLFVVSGPSGAGKGTAMHHLLTAVPAMVHVPTYTTRAPRSGEQDGVDYRFVTEDRFAGLRADGTIFESRRTYGDELYGAPAALLDPSGPSWLLAELDIAGYHRARRMSGRRVVGLFITPPTIAELERRIRARSGDGNLAARLDVAREQLRQGWSYDHVLLNDDLDRFLAAVSAVAAAEIARAEGFGVLGEWLHE